MAVATLNPALTALRGRVGPLVFKTYRATHRIVVTRIPCFDGYVPSAAQVAHRARLREATAYAKHVYATPALKAHYLAAAQKLGRQAFRLAVSDYLRGRPLPAASPAPAPAPPPAPAHAAHDDTVPPCPAWSAPAPTHLSPRAPHPCEPPTPPRGSDGAKPSPAAAPRRPASVDLKSAGETPTARRKRSRKRKNHARKNSFAPAKHIGLKKRVLLSVLRGLRVSTAPIGMQPHPQLRTRNPELGARAPETRTPPARHASVL